MGDGPFGKRPAGWATFNFFLRNGLWAYTGRASRPIRRRRMGDDRKRRVGAHVISLAPIYPIVMWRWRPQITTIFISPEPLGAEIRCSSLLGGH